MYSRVQQHRRGIYAQPEVGETRLLSDTMQDYLSDVEFGKIEPWKFKSEKET